MNIDEKISDLAFKTADEIVKRGHCKDVLEDPLSGNVCALGGMNYAHHGSPNNAATSARRNMWGAKVGTGEITWKTDEGMGLISAMLDYLKLPKKDPLYPNIPANPATQASRLAIWNNAPERTSKEVIGAFRVVGEMYAARASSQSDVDLASGPSQ